MVDQKRILLLLMVWVCILLSCSSEKYEIEIPPFPKIYSLDTIFVENCVRIQRNECNVDSNMANIRIRNLSLFEICDIEYIPYFNSYFFDPVLPGESTCYIAMDLAYRYPALVNFRLRSGDAAVGAIDLLGESPISKGFYTFDLSILNLKNGHEVHGRFNYDDDQSIFLQSHSEPCKTRFEIECPEIIDKSNSTYIRVVNSSILNLCNFKIEDAKTSSLLFGNIRPNESTCYVPLKGIEHDELVLDCIVNKQNTSRRLNSTFGNGLYSLHVAIADLAAGEIVYRLLKDE